MYTINDIKVELLNPEEVKNFIKKSWGICMSML